MTAWSLARSPWCAGGSECADIASEGELEIRMLVVDPAEQRSGAGRVLMGVGIARARELEDVHTVALTTGSQWGAARALYEVEGFVQDSARDRYVPNTEIALVLYTLVL